MRPTITIACGAIAIAILASGCGGSSKTAAPGGVLLVQTAPHGTYEHVSGTTDRFVLSLRDHAEQVIWFTDRPERHFGHIPVERFVANWKKLGFASDPPNAALTLLHGDDSSDTVIMKLGQPDFDRARHTLTFPVTRLPHATGNLADFEDDNDGRVPPSFADASLFIDDVNQNSFSKCCQY